MKSGKRSLENMPTIVDAHIYGSEWVEWWTAAQPPERETHQWPFPRETIGDMGWSKFPANGKDGVFLAVMGLSWWAPAIQSLSEIAFFEEAVTDLDWVIQELVRIRTSLTPSPALPPSQSEPKPRRHNRAPPSRNEPRPRRHNRAPRSSSSSRPRTSSPCIQSSRPHVSSSHVQSSRPRTSSSRVQVPYGHPRGEGKRTIKPTWKAMANS